MRKIIFCECGCGKLTTWNKRKKRWNKRLVGHYERTPEIKQKISQKAKIHSYFHKYNKTKEHSENVRKSNASRIVTEEQKRKISKSLKGHKRTRKSCLKQSITMIDNNTSYKENNSQWKGGITSRKNIGEWIKLSKEIKKRDNYTCRDCNSKSNLNVHHIDFDGNNHSPLNLITLCRSCHRKRHIRR